MSQIALSPNPAGTGTFTIEAPNSNTNRTLTLPDQSGSFITTDASGAAILPRVDSSNEGGQINFNRAVDNVPNWSIDSFGNNTTPALRIIDNGSVRAAIDGSGNFQFNSGYGSAATAYGCRAWVNFNGTGTVAIRASGNVSSITDNGTGDYTVNFTTAMPDANYAVQTMATWAADSNTFQLVHGINRTTLPTTTACRVNGVSPSSQGTAVDSLYFSVAIFR